MFGYKHYVPILKGKQGEFRALSNLSTSMRSKLTPFFDMPRPDSTWKKTIDAYLINKVLSIHQCWGFTRECFVDYTDFSLTQRTCSDEHYIKFSFDNFRNYNVQAIPVTGLDRDDNYNNAISRIFHKDKRGIAVRLQNGDIETPSTTKRSVGDLLTFLKVKDQDVYLFLDFRDVDRSELTQK